MKTISVVIPIFNEEEIAVTVKEINDYIPVYGKEIILIDDGSTDNTWSEIEKLADQYSYIKGISFARNFGKESAILAGLACATGDAVITIDADLQHPPNKIPEFIEKWGGGAKVVEGIKRSRGNEKFYHRLFTRLFYRIMSNAIGSDLSNSSDYKLLDREVVDVILQMPEKRMFYRAITSWVGFETLKVEYDVDNRRLGKTKWSTYKLFKYAIKNVTSFSSAPLQIITIFSFLFFLLAIIIGFFSIAKYAMGRALEGFTTVILLQLIIGSVIMFSLGVIGYYIAGICDEVKFRPRYIIERRTGDE